MKRILYIFVCLSLMALLLACGDSKETQSSNMDSDKTGINESNISTNDDKQDESLNVEESQTKNSDSENTVESSNDNKEEMQKIEYLPESEILNASIDSGMVQIGDDIFKIGGYYTVDSFIEQYKDKYSFPEINTEEIIKGRENLRAITHSSLVKSKEGDISFYIVYCNFEKEDSRLGNAVIFGFDFGYRGEGDGNVVSPSLSSKPILEGEFFDVFEDNVWLPQEYNKTYLELSKEAKKLNTYDKVVEYYKDQYGAEMVDFYSDLSKYNIKMGLKVEDNESCDVFIRAKEENLLGCYPIFTISYDMEDVSDMEASGLMAKYCAYYLYGNDICDFSK